MYKSKKGFTLIELIVVIAIISIILGMAAPSSNVIRKSKEKSELKELKRDIEYARDNAIFHNQVYSVIFYVNENRYVIKSNKNNIIKKKTLSSDLKILRTNFINDRIIFSYIGAPNRGGTISLTNSKGEIINVTVRPATGKAFIYAEEKNVEGK